MAVADSGAEPDPAVTRARRVVGLYGDPDVTWSIVLAVTTAEPRSADAAAAAVAALVGAHPHLGPAPTLTTFDDGAEASVCAEFADRPYGDHEPLLRVALSADGRTLVVAAHHGAMDGLGLLGAAAVIGGRDLASSARGISRDEQPGGFLSRAVARLAEVALHPPRRLAVSRPGDGDHTVVGDLLLARTVTAARPGSAALVAGVVDAVQRWNAAHPIGRNGGRGARLVVAMGLSRRPGTPYPPPDRDTAYVRLFADQVRTAADASTLITTTPPEPAFPETDGGGIGPLAARLLGNRLGATVLVSNLGVVADPGVVALRFWPVPTGPRGFAVGLASTTVATTLTVRLRSRWCTPVVAEEVADLVVERFVAAASDAR